MDNFIRQAGERSPLVNFDFSNHKLVMEGESYPEDAAAFFGPMMEALKAYLEGVGNNSLIFDLRLVYFNSSSAKALMNMFQLFEKAAERGAGITINWWYHPEDDTMEEFGEDFSEDFQAVAFNLKTMED